MFKKSCTKIGRIEEDINKLLKKYFETGFSFANILGNKIPSRSDWPQRLNNVVRISYIN